MWVSLGGLYRRTDGRYAAHFWIPYINWVSMGLGEKSARKAAGTKAEQAAFCVA